MPSQIGHESISRRHTLDEGRQLFFHTRLLHHAFLRPTRHCRLLLIFASNFSHTDSYTQRYQGFVLCCTLMSVYPIIPPPLQTHEIIVTMTDAGLRLPSQDMLLHSFNFNWIVLEVQEHWWQLRRKLSIQELVLKGNVIPPTMSSKFIQCVYCDCKADNATCAFTQAHRHISYY
ncbi:hypothetical protein AZE42_11419 [Rhizopogon vesiculosus]|uniref:Uncharacterized protein n=1 Tax=Rhizopogon vesiculosus TaxID=180088 RepID=A0A1J8PN72_9AGAM|nr:hypothetical protein AZE42_11419 [Rhizopogon vesiculosus]